MSIKIENLTHTYMPKTPFEKIAIDDVSLEIKQGEFVALIGHTGSGKSNLIQHINGLLKPTTGSIFIDDLDITKKNVNWQALEKKWGLYFNTQNISFLKKLLKKILLLDHII